MAPSPRQTVGRGQIHQQVLIGPYIVDFAARERKLVIELDGDSHGTQERYDARRTALIEQEGFRVIRFSNSDIMTNLDGVLLAIADALAALPPSQPSPQRGEG